MSLQANFPNIRPTLLLDFANAKVLDPRVTFTRASTATYFDNEGVLRTAASGEPRFAFDPDTEESLGLLIEEARTNLLTYSEQFDNAAWVKSGNTALTANTVIAPDGTLTGDSIAAVAGGSNSAKQFPAVSAGATYTFSAFVKAGSSNFAFFTLYDNGSNVRRQWFNLTTGALGSTTSGGTFVLLSASMALVGNGWYKCVVTATTPAGITNCFFGVESASADASTSDITNGSIAIWGAQLEAGSFPTSYIPTVASQVTRDADVASMTGVNFSSWFNQAEGTLYSEWQKFAPSSFQSISSISDGNVNNQITLAHGSISGSNNNMRFDVNASASTQASLTLVTNSASNTFYKSAGAYRINDFAGVANAGAIQSDSLGLIPVVSRLNVGVNASASGGYLNGTIKKLAYYPIRLTNEQLQALTA
jgi:hypothetical protein